MEPYCPLGIIKKRHEALPLTVIRHGDGAPAIGGELCLHDFRSHDAHSGFELRQIMAREANVDRGYICSLACLAVNSTVAPPVAKAAQEISRRLGWVEARDGARDGA
jgi:hypothetical protein